MKNNSKKYIYLALAAAMSQSTFASDGLYAGAGLMIGDIKGEEDNVTVKIPANVLTATAGKEINQNLDVEGRVYLTLSDATKTLSDGSKVKASIPLSIMAAVKPKFDLSKELNAYGVLGLSNASVDLKVSSASGSGSASTDSDLKTVFGFGAQYNLDSGLFINGEYLSLIQKDIGNTKISFSGLNVFVGKRF